MTLEFQPITPDKQQAYQTYLSVCPQVTSDYSFVNLWGWADEYGLYWAWEKDLIWIQQTRPAPIYWAPIGPWESILWEERFGQYPLESNKFTRIPEKLARYWETLFSQEHGLSIGEERGNWDYVYNVGELIDLKGNRFHKKKNLLNQFKRNYNYQYLPLSLDMTAQAMGLQSDWCTWRDCESSDTLSAENRSIQKILTAWERLDNLTGGAITVNGKLIAYTIAEPLTKHMILIHFEKANPDFKGSYQAINQMFLAHLTGKYSTVNREQDLDDKNLRQAKLSYQPTGFLKKYHAGFSF